MIWDRNAGDVETINRMYPGFGLTAVSDDFEAAEADPELEDRNELIYSYIAGLIYRQSIS